MCKVLILFCVVLQPPRPCQIHQWVIKETCCMAEHSSKSQNLVLNSSQDLNVFPNYQIYHRDVWGHTDKVRHIQSPGGAI